MSDARAGVVPAEAAARWLDRLMHLAPDDAGGVVAVKWAAGCVEEERAGAATVLGGGDVDVFVAEVADRLSSLAVVERCQQVDLRGVFEAKHLAELGRRRPR